MGVKKPGITDKDSRKIYRSRIVNSFLLAEGREGQKKKRRGERYESNNVLVDSAYHIHSH